MAGACPKHCNTPQGSIQKDPILRHSSDTIRLQLLRLLADNPQLTQRELAQALGVSLGATHYSLRALIDKGLVKAENFRNSQNKRAYAYLLTPKGLTEKLHISRASAVLLETDSATTRGNAVYTAQLLEDRGLERVLLVTSALHMERALATFRAAGVEAWPAPTDFEVEPLPPDLLRWLPDAQALADSTRALKEYLGLWVYRWRGWAE